MSGRTIVSASYILGNSRQTPPNINLSIEMKGGLLGRVRRSTLICCLKTRISASSATQWARSPPPKASPMPTHQRLEPDNRETLQDRRKPAIQLDKEPAIMVREPDATMQPTPQDNQLMSQHRILSLKSQLRLEWRGQDGQNETEQPDHSASLGDSITSSTRIRFSVHTAGLGLRRDIMWAELSVAIRTASTVLVV